MPCLMSLNSNIGRGEWYEVLPFIGKLRSSLLLETTSFHWALIIIKTSKLDPGRVWSRRESWLAFHLSSQEESHWMMDRWVKEEVRRLRSIPNHKLLVKSQKKIWSRSVWSKPQRGHHFGARYDDFAKYPVRGELCKSFQEKERGKFISLLFTWKK